MNNKHMDREVEGSMQGCKVALERVSPEGRGEAEAEGFEMTAHSSM